MKRELNISLEQSKRLDEILKETFDSTHVNFQTEGTNDGELICLLGELGLVEIIAEDDQGVMIMLTQSGETFVNFNGFEREYYKALEDKKMAALLKERTEREVKAAKMQPYLIAWSIITTLTTIILAILQYMKKC